MERGVHVFGHEQVGLALEHLLEGVPGMLAPKRVVRRLLLEAVVTDEDDREAALAPRADQRADVALAVRIVPRAPGGVVEGLLDVEHDEGGAAHSAGALVVDHQRSAPDLAGTPVGASISWSMTTRRRRLPRKAEPPWRADSVSTCHCIDARLMPGALLGGPSSDETPADAGASSIAGAGFEPATFGL